MLGTSHGITTSSWPGQSVCRANVVSATLSLRHCQPPPHRDQQSSQTLALTFVPVQVCYFRALALTVWPFSSSSTFQIPSHPLPSLVVVCVLSRKNSILSSYGGLRPPSELLSAYYSIFLLYLKSIGPKQQIISSQSKTTASTSYNYKSVQDMKSSSQDIYNTACIIFGSVVGANYECPSILAFESFHFFDVIRDLFHLAFQIRNIQTKDNY